ncbi:SDR family NAD(P)-dependent oxidoreductase [Levilactobacillus zymae]|uniref:Short-chain dehydrogenase/reductase n=1 Tax=Levilactobacillus zymae TaxID=267363 RepID=A0ABQ0WXG4_9LACO|nr:SDR family NAD(P)-dependent oxidoreductase [Levilactobacillus zymae]KRL06862.1 short chain dehydrogenase [Levilactobacillus zymae DSM 19395]MDT6979607.1 SDR family NAD(P)-dependent oxidoreductase [Levilactobacillus zymae]QFR61746.1 SDR family NAD(P)-dependent oxidoreductase [Levilactobacillus zymae]GEO72233.1 short-chain dehydrogenase/reductase [Levilactobacillus zymae]
MTKTWLITGTSTGFGKSLATFLAQKDDVNLVATARHTDQLGYLDQYDHGQILKATLDVTNRDEIAAVVKATTDKFHGIDVLINNAGLGYFGTFEESDRDAVRYMFDVNVWGLIDMTRAVLPTMRAQKRGIVVNFSSIAGLASFPTLSFYNSSKYAVEGVTEAAAQEVAGLGIKFMLIEPSGFRTDWAGRSSQKTMPKLADYQQFASRIEGSEEGAHHEAGDPDKAAAIIYDQVTNHAADLPLRLPLGQWSTDTAIDKYTKTLANFKALHDLSASADQPEK